MHPRFRVELRGEEDVHLRVGHNRALPIDLWRQVLVQFPYLCSANDHQDFLASNQQFR